MLLELELHHRKDHVLESTPSVPSVVPTSGVLDVVEGEGPDHIIGLLADLADLPGQGQTLDVVLVAD